MTKKILVPLDGSELSEKAIEKAVSLLEAEGKMVLLRVLELPEIGTWAPIDAVVAHQEEEKMVREYLKDLATKWKGRGVNLETRIHPGPNPGNSIVAAAEEEEVDLIVMSSHGRTGFARFMLGSVAEKVVRHCPGPIYILKEPRD